MGAGLDRAAEPGLGPRRRTGQTAVGESATVVFFFNDTATTEIYTLSLHDALPIWSCRRATFSAPFPRPPSFRWPSCSSVSTAPRSEEHTSELQSRRDLVCRLLLEKKKKNKNNKQLKKKKKKKKKKNYKHEKQ